MKLIFLRLVTILYEGESIGDDITIDVQAGDTFFTLNKRLKNGAEARIDKTVATFTASVDPWVIPISVTITERDPLFNDSATQAERFSLSLAAAPSRTFKLSLEVKENPAGRAPAVGVFALEFAAEIAEAIRYIPPSDDGFTVVLAEPSRKRTPLPSALAVQVERIADAREYFVVLEGRMKGQRASISLGGDKESRLRGEQPHTQAVRLKYSLSKQTLSTEDDSRTYAAISTATPIAPGLYDLEIPDAPHRGGVFYPAAPHARVWFRIGHKGDRYLHPGTRSAGCVTVLETARWEELYALLIGARKGDGISVGTLHVVE